MIQCSDNIVILLDALDECITRKELLDWINVFASCNIQLIMTSRPEEDFKCEVPRFFDERNCIPLDKKAVNADIRSYVTETLKNRSEFANKGLSQDLLNEICDKIGDGADGMKVWPTL